mmetsp:Transcript_27081/g.31242  ORF Transcript_27081/g.31242 Transcript_27081/m.31242 type:complete len:118 (+) Transcript_27081:71-424(+)|eukprot:CAMPEP_0115001464 /NCGR_PEP_ID=MMETSP0216-20121206/17396_1 /TAXON_ID=223996 /ORGANISM="Protocruzia adherens, Strain Boccale" /LENGTH=117 /DNA_ID=CAMNT_0002366813 /DNA_START=659 /DNA_END=1012 /DNA_ORIENTATION=-
MVRNSEKKPMGPLTIDYTINLHKKLQKTTFKKKATRAVRYVKQFGAKVMKTSDVRVDTKLNQFLWSNGIRNVPYRVRVRFSRQRNDDEESGDKFFTLAQYVPVESFKKMKTEKSESA